MNVGQGALAADKARALALTPVSRETETLLDSFVETLLLATEHQNLIGPSTIPTVWTRHVADSLQILDLAPDAKTWVDFGTGAGFPGIPIACALKDRPGAMIHLVESVGKKAAFLRDAVAATGVPAQVHHMRAEDFPASHGDSVDVVTARAVSPLKVLFELAFPLITRGAVGLFPKGQDVDAELTEAARYWIIEAKKAPSKTSPEGAIVIVTGLTPRRGR
ncbi:MAG TPA: 16S rRNA (guanine(527)-N(7))-methyltransferase RsmG [Pseudolabrys sp.]|nr:16S rRNA (guanine(527)-N(7))-methyltransferase RsmG [Pseudolabrys sp.]